MKQNFKILTIEEENKLTKEELKEYYINLRNYLAERKLTNTSIGATTLAPKLNELTKKITQLGFKKIKGKNIKIVSEGLENIPTERVLFVHTYEDLVDNLLPIIEINRHCLSMTTKEKNQLLLLCQLSNGLISINKDNKIDKYSAKLDAIRLLLEGNSITCFIDNSIIQNPIKTYEFLEIAQKAGVPIIPVVHKYKYNNAFTKDAIKEIHSIYGTPIHIDENDDIYQKLEEYNEAIFNMRTKLTKSLYKKERVLNNK